MTSIIKGGMKTKTFTKTTTVPASGTKSESFDITLSGYKPIGIMGCDAPHARIAVSGFGINNNSAYLTAVNTYSGELSGTSSITVLYIPS